MVLVGSCLQGWFPLKRLPWNLPAMPGIFTGPPLTLDGTSSKACQLAMSLTCSGHSAVEKIAVHQITFYSQAILPDYVLAFVHTFVPKNHGILIVLMLIVIYVYVNCYYFTCIIIYFIMNSI